MLQMRRFRRSQESMSMSHGLAASFLVLLAPAFGLAQQPHKCNQKHPGRAHRADSLLKRGDARMVKSVAGHVTKYAIERYALTDLVKEADITRATNQLDGFLKWKLGNTSAVSGTWLAHGYEHFDKGYADEAAAALLGFELPKEKGGHSMFYLPPELVDLWVMTEKLKNKGKAYLLQAAFGIPPSLSEAVLNEITKQEGKVLKRLGFNIPKAYDFPNELLLATIKVRRNPAAYKKEFAQRIEEAMRHEAAAGSSGAPTGPNRD
jgi:hypothetical protein